MSQTTKKAFAASLKKLLAKKPLSKITISDITDECEVNRQTFYYHFQDIYALVEWTYTYETSKALEGKKTYGTWQHGFLQIFRYILENKAFVMGTYHSLSREHLERFLLERTYDLLIDVVNELAGGVSGGVSGGISGGVSAGSSEEISERISVREEDKQFIADFYKFGFVGLTLDWIGTGMKDEPENIINKLALLLDGDFANALRKFRTGAIK